MKKVSRKDAKKRKKLFVSRLNSKLLQAMREFFLRALCVSVVNLIFLFGSGYAKLGTSEKPSVLPAASALPLT